MRDEQNTHHAQATATRTVHRGDHTTYGLLTPVTPPRLPGPRDVEVLALWTHIHRFTCRSMRYESCDLGGYHLHDACMHPLACQVEGGHSESDILAYIKYRTTNLQRCAADRTSLFADPLVAYT
jgi:hypothetical protein